MTAKPHRPTVVITHHAPSCLGLNPLFVGSPLDPAYASSFAKDIGTFENVRVWVHGYSHIVKTYGMGNTVALSRDRAFSKGLFCFGCRVMTDPVFSGSLPASPDRRGAVEANENHFGRPTSSD